jgi:cob(I)alamin adenosyltransferase
MISDSKTRYIAGNYQVFVRATLSYDPTIYMVAQINQFGASFSDRAVTKKTNSSQTIGAALQAAVAGRRVLVVQFLKGGLHQGQDHMVNLAQNLDWLRSDLMRQCATGELSTSESKSLRSLWQHAQELIRSVEYQLVILEDLQDLVAMGLIEQSEVERLLQNLPASVEIVIPGITSNQDVYPQAS